MSTTDTHELPGVLLVLIGNGLYDYLRCDCKQIRKTDRKIGANLLIDEKLFSHIFTEPTFLVAFYTTQNLDCAVSSRVSLDIASWRFRHVYWKPGEKGRGKLAVIWPYDCISTDHVPIMRCEYCPIEQGYGNRMFDYWSFGNRTFDCVWLENFICEFNYVRLSSAIEWLELDWVRLDTLGIPHVWDGET